MSAASYNRLAAFPAPDKRFLAILDAADNLHVAIGHAATITKRLSLGAIEFDGQKGLAHQHVIAAARALGNAYHDLLDALAQQIGSPERVSDSDDLGDEFAIRLQANVDALGRYEDEYASERLTVSSQLGARVA